MMEPRMDTDCAIGTPKMMAWEGDPTTWSLKRDQQGFPAAFQFPHLDCPVSVPPVSGRVFLGAWSTSAQLALMRFSSPMEGAPMCGVVTCRPCFGSHASANQAISAETDLQPPESHQSGWFPGFHLMLHPLLG